jgi:3-phosphoshikimate 1-carboxyvinyltransferase
MAFLMLGLGAEQPVEVDEAQMIATSFPDFAKVMQAIGGNVKEAQ